MKLICSVLAMVLVAGRLDLYAQIPAPRATQSSVAHAEASLDVVDADTLARIHKALHAPYSDSRLTAVPAQYLRAQPPLRSRNGTVVDEVAWGAAIGTLVPAGQLFFGCFMYLGTRPQRLQQGDDGEIHHCRRRNRRAGWARGRHLERTLKPGR